MTRLAVMVAINGARFGGVLITEQAERRHSARPVASGALAIQNGRHIVRIRHRRCTRREKCSHDRSQGHPSIIGPQRAVHHHPRRAASRTAIIKFGSGSERLQALPAVPPPVGPAARNAARASRGTPISGRCAISASKWKRAKCSGWWGRTVRQEHAAADRQRHSAAHQRPRGHARAHRRAARTGRGLQSGIHRPRERLPQRRDHGTQPRGNRKGHALHRSLRRNRRIHRAAGEGILERHVCAAGLLDGHPRGPGDSDRGRSAGGGRRGVRQSLRAQISGTARAQDHGAVRLARSRPGEATLRPRDLLLSRAHRSGGQTQRRDQSVYRAGAREAGARRDERGAHPLAASGTAMAPAKFST